MKENRHIVLVLVMSSFVIDLIFDLVPQSTEKYYFFPFFLGYKGWDGSMTTENYVYLFCEHVSGMSIWLAFYKATGWRLMNYIFFVELSDLVDFCLCYNSTWFRVYGHPVEYNDFKIGIVTFLTTRDSWMHFKSSL